MEMIVRMKLNYKKDLRRIILFYWAVPILTALVLFPLLPIILNYPPDSIDNQFQLEFDGITYTQQYILLVFLIIFFSLIFLLIRVFKISKSFSILEKKSDSLSKKEISVLILKIRSFCMNTPYLLYFLEILVPLIFLPVTFMIIKAYPLTIIKICLIYLSFFTLGSVISLIFSKNQFRRILMVLHDNYTEIMDDIEFGLASRRKSEFKSLTSKLILQLFPLVLISLIITSLVGYVQASTQTGDIYYESYRTLMEKQFNHPFRDQQEMRDTLEEIGFLNDAHLYFMIDSSGNYITSDHSELQPFFIKYTLEKSVSEQGRTYDYFCLDVEGIATKCITLDGQTYFVGYLYNTQQPQFLKFILISDVILFMIIFVILLYVSASLSKDIKVVTSKLNEIASDNRNEIRLNHNLAITSEDEVADLVMAFNVTQRLIKRNVKQIHENQDMLMEKERLASLGQLIGGIAHNLKTPIMSISGAAEGLSDLIKEYNSSIDDPDVNSQDHHEIAKDMASWVEKVKEYTGYMSDVITAVKGQAVTLSEAENITFDVEELVKRIDILMKHELKSALIYLNVELHTSEKTSLHGDINSLVQVINNMISNAIQAYGGKPEQTIDFIVDQTDSHQLMITIRDYASGLPESVKAKLFKEMITTKGKNGTGLGLYMSYSTIRAHFGGDITFESEKGKGTSFHIILPL